MLLSIIVPCYNSSLYIEETINSIKNIKPLDFECIIINDGSTDNSETVINKCINNLKNFKLINIEHKGVGYARNIGLQNARGKYILPIDSDDLLMPEYAFNGVNFLEKNNDYSLYYGKVKYIGEKDGSIFGADYLSYKRMLLYDCICVSGIYRRDKAIEIGGYDEELYAMEDYDFWIRYLYHNDKIMFSDETGFQYRVHSDSRHNSKSMKDIFEIKKIIYEKNKMIYDEYFLKRKN